MTPVVLDLLIPLKLFLEMIEMEADELRFNFRAFLFEGRHFQDEF